MAHAVLPTFKDSELPRLRAVRVLTVTARAWQLAPRAGRAERPERPEFLERSSPCQTVPGDACRDRVPAAARPALRLAPVGLACAWGWTP